MLSQGQDVRCLRSKNAGHYADSDPLLRTGNLPPLRWYYGGKDEKLVDRRMQRTLLLDSPQPRNSSWATASTAAGESSPSHCTRTRRAFEHAFGSVQDDQAVQ